MIGFTCIKILTLHCINNLKIVLIAKHCINIKISIWNLNNAKGENHRGSPQATALLKREK